MLTLTSPPGQLTKLDYKFGDDGVFWMTYQDMLLTFTNLHRTRIFDKTWTVVQEWTSVDVAWITGYLQRKFIVEVKQAGVVVLVLSQVGAGPMHSTSPPPRSLLTGRSSSTTAISAGLRGQYSFLLHFVLQKEGRRAGRLRVPRASQVGELCEGLPVHQLRGGAAAGPVRGAAQADGHEGRRRAYDRGHGQGPRRDAAAEAPPGGPELRPGPRQGRRPGRGPAPRRQAGGEQEKGGRTEGEGGRQSSSSSSSSRGLRRPTRRRRRRRSRAPRLLRRRRASRTRRPRRGPAAATCRPTRRP